MGSKCLLSCPDFTTDVPFCLPACALNLHLFAAWCSALLWRTNSLSAQRCASGSLGVVPPTSSFWWTFGGFLVHGGRFPASCHRAEYNENTVIDSAGQNLKKHTQTCKFSKGELELLLGKHYFEYIISWVRIIRQRRPNLLSDKFLICCYYQ